MSHIIVIILKYFIIQYIEQEGGSDFNKIFSGISGILHINLIHEHLTIYSACYRESPDKTELAFKAKIVGFSSTRRNYSAWQCQSFQTNKTLNNLFWVVMGHPPYSPPCDYHMFGFPKGKFRGYRYDNDTALDMFVGNWLKTPPPPSFFFYNHIN